MAFTVPGPGWPGYEDGTDSFPWWWQTQALASGLTCLGVHYLWVWLPCQGPDGPILPCPQAFQTRLGHRGCQEPLILGQLNGRLSEISAPHALC